VKLKYPNKKTYHLPQNTKNLENAQTVFIEFIVWKMAYMM
jgi:hypothetical protein